MIGEETKNYDSIHNSLWAVLKIGFLLSVFLFSWIVLYNSDSDSPFKLLPPPSLGANVSLWEAEEFKLDKVLRKAAMKDRSIILTTLNKAWAAQNSMVDIFLKSFKYGIDTHKLLNHLVVIAMDEKAYSRCLALHLHCYALKIEGVDFSSEAYFMTPQYLKMMWARIHFLATILELGYNFVFTDADIMWFRDPFPRFDLNAEFQIACDYYLGNSEDVHNSPNGGFMYVKSSNRTIEFYKFWYESRVTYPLLNDQDVLNKIKYDPFVSQIGLQLRFLDTAYFGGLCEPSKDFNLVCTMHANCCTGLDRKLQDLRIMHQDWKKYLKTKTKSAPSWSVPHNCRISLNEP